jgi:hypothetical protein
VTVFFNDMYAFNLSSNTWSVVDCSSSMILPSPRAFRFLFSFSPSSAFFLFLFFFFFFFFVHLYFICISLFKTLLFFIKIMRCIFMVVLMERKFCFYY